MAVYSSKFATKNVQPSVGWDHRRLKRFAFVLGILAVTALSAYGLWRATMGVPDPAELPAIVAE